MATQGAPSRPWFRLATMARPPPSAAPAPPPPQPDQAPPPPRPAFIRPAFAQTFQAPPPPPQPTAPPPPANVVAPKSSPTPPVTRATPAPPSSPKEPRPLPSPRNTRSPPLQQSGPSSPAATSPPPPQSSRSMAPTTRAATPISSPPKTVKQIEKTPPPSPNIKPVSNPPSPLALPSPQLKSYYPNKQEYDQKSMLVQETKEKPKGLNNGSNGDLRRSTGWGTHNPKAEAPKKPEASKKHLDSEDLGMRIITIAGENKGAIMELTPSGNKTHKFGNNPHTLHMKRDNPTDGEKSGTNSDGKSKAKNKNSPLMTAVMNSNVQGVNNSILFNSSTSHHDPGVHLSFSRKPSGGHGFLLKDQKDHTN